MGITKKFEKVRVALSYDKARMNLKTRDGKVFHDGKKIVLSFGSPTDKTYKEAMEWFKKIKVKAEEELETNKPDCVYKNPYKIAEYERDGVKIKDMQLEIRLSGVYENENKETGEKELVEKDFLIPEFTVKGEINEDITFPFAGDLVDIVLDFQQSVHQGVLRLKPYISSCDIVETRPRSKSGSKKQEDIIDFGDEFSDEVKKEVPKTTAKTTAKTATKKAVVETPLEEQIGVDLDGLDAEFED